MLRFLDDISVNDIHSIGKRLDEFGSHFDIFIEGSGSVLIYSSCHRFLTFSLDECHRLLFSKKAGLNIFASLHGL